MVAAAVTTQVHTDPVAVAVQVHRCAVAFAVATGVHRDTTVWEVRKDHYSLRTVVHGDTHAKPWQPLAPQGSLPREGRSTGTTFLETQSPKNRKFAPL